MGVPSGAEHAGEAIDRRSETMDIIDRTFMWAARENARSSTCISHPLGAVLVTRNGDIIDGWNGGPVDIECGTMFGHCPRKKIGAGSGERMDLCIAVHAERRPLLIAASAGVKTNGSTLYAFCGIPCKDCMIELIAAGVKRIVCLDDDKFNRKTPTAYNFELSKKLADAAGMIIEMVKESDVGKEG